MKICECCGEEIGGEDSVNHCPACEMMEQETTKQRERRKAKRRAREQAMRDCGLVKVRGALGGIYWE